MSLTITEKEVIRKFKDKGYSFLKNGHPDFLFFKYENNKLIDAIFVEVKSANCKLSENQELFLKILKDLNLNIDVKRMKNEECQLNKDIKVGVNLKCKRCKRKWEYNGKKIASSYPVYVCCPRCKTVVKL